MCVSGMAALAIGVPRLKFLWVQACQVELAGVRMLAQRPEFVVEVVKESCTSNGVITPWQLIAYSSAAPPRTDLPDNIDHVHDKYCTPLYSEYYLCLAPLKKGPRKSLSLLPVMLRWDNLNQAFSRMQHYSL